MWPEDFETRVCSTTFLKQIKKPGSKLSHVGGGGMWPKNFRIQVSKAILFKPFMKLRYELKTSKHFGTNNSPMNMFMFISVCPVFYTDNVRL